MKKKINLEAFKQAKIKQKCHHGLGISKLRLCSKNRMKMGSNLFETINKQKLTITSIDLNLSVLCSGPLVLHFKSTLTKIWRPSFFDVDHYKKIACKKNLVKEGLNQQKLTGDIDYQAPDLMVANPCGLQTK
jgi:hypothetical protein